MKTEEHERAADLIAMLMRDSAARAAFRRSPAAMCRDHGLDDVAAELAGRDGALQSLDVRESRSSVAGVLIAAAAEGVAFFAFIEDAHAASGGGGGFSPDVAKIVALTRPHLPAVVPEGNGAGVAHVAVAAAADARAGRRRRSRRSPTAAPPTGGTRRAARPDRDRPAAEAGPRRARGGGRAARPRSSLRRPRRPRPTSCTTRASRSATRPRRRSRPPARRRAPPRS